MTPSFMRNKDQTIDYIIDNVKELQPIKAVDDVDYYKELIWNAYVDECSIQKRLMTEDNFIEEIHNSIGWDWVFISGYLSDL